MELSEITVSDTIDYYTVCTEPVPVTIPLRSRKMETTMNTTINDTTSVARQALDQALNRLEDAVINKAYETYGFKEERKPKTAQELIDWIKNDEFTAPDTKDEDYDPDDYRYDSLLGIRFKPLKKKDREGYEKHAANFIKDRNALRLEIRVLEPEKALASFRKLEKEYLH